MFFLISFLFILQIVNNLSLNGFFFSKFNFVHIIFQNIKFIHNKKFMKEFFNYYDISKKTTDCFKKKTNPNLKFRQSNFISISKYLYFGSHLVIGSLVFRFSLLQQALICFLAALLTTTVNPIMLSSSSVTLSCDGGSALELRPPSSPVQFEPARFLGWFPRSGSRSPESRLMARFCCHPFIQADRND